MLNYLLEAVVRMAAHSQEQQPSIGRESCALGHGKSALSGTPTGARSVLSQRPIDESPHCDRRGACPDADNASDS